MTRFPSLRLDVSTDMDFFPVLKHSIADLALALDVPESEFEKVNAEVKCLFERDLMAFESPNLCLELRVESGCLDISAYDAAGNRVAKREVPFA